jgi:hypothetical protein
MIKLQLIINFEAARSLIFYQDKAGTVHMNVVEILSDKSTSLVNSVPEIMKTAFANMYSGKHTNTINVSANVVFYNEDYNYESSFKITNGTLTKNKFIIQNRKSSVQNRAINTLTSTTSCGGCETYYVVGTLYYIDTGEIIYQEILGSYQDGPGCDINDGGQYGGGDAPPDPNECFIQCQANSDGLSSGVTTASETTSTDISAIDNFKKYKNPKWTCLKGAGWILSSQEIGIIELVDVQANKWVWNSLTHCTITKTGISLGGTVSPNTGTGTPSFVAGTPNVLYAGMSLNFDVTYSPVCDCPLISTYAPPYSLNYISTGGVWNANPF